VLKDLGVLKGQQVQNNVFIRKEKNAEKFEIEKGFPNLSLGLHSSTPMSKLNHHRFNYRK
jgi:hypothetical protein